MEKKGNGDKTVHVFQVAGHLRLFEHFKENDVTVYLIYSENVFPLTVFVQQLTDQLLKESVHLRVA